MTATAIAHQRITFSSLPEKNHGCRMTTTDTEKDKDKDGITLPGWFLKVITILTSVFVISFVPWAAWMTNSTYSLHYQVQDVPAIRRQMDEQNKACELKFQDLQAKYLEIKIDLIKLQKAENDHHGTN